MTSAGFKEVDFGQEADIYIINTCSVTSVADAKSRQLIHKAAGQNGKVYITGCSVENPESNVNSNGVTIIPNDKKIKYFQNIGDSHSKQVVLAADKAGDCHQNYFRSRPLVHIQNGCTQHCSYCIVPSLRGKKSVSKDVDEVLREVEEIARSGFEEIVLTGINIGLYNYKGARLSGLIEEITKINSNFRIRISSIELNTITPSLIENIFNSKVANHLHIPLQSGSNKILGSMNRPYRVEDFIKKVDLLKEQDPDLAVSTDCIVGFPGETEEDFYQTKEAIKRIKFAKVHVFRYSPRPMTIAADFVQDVSEAEKKKRSSELQVVAGDLRDDYLISQTGKEVSVLCERFEKDYLYGISGNYIKVKFKGSKCLLKKLARVRIIKVSEEYCAGELIL